MKNIIILTIDSLSAEAIYDEQYGRTAMPFLRKLMKEYTCVNNYYSEGPHTELGLQAMLTGMHTLDNGTSVRRLVYADKTIFDYFYEAGYKLANITWPSNYYPKRFYGIIEDYFTQGDSFQEVVYWRLGYCVDLYNRNEIQEQDYNDLIGCFFDSFNSYLKFLNPKQHNANAYVLTKNRIKNVDFSNRYNLVKREYNRFLSNPRCYVVDILKNNGKLPEILAVDDNDSALENELVKEKYLKLYKENKLFFLKLKLKQILGSVFDARVSWLDICRDLYKILQKKPHDYIRTFNSRINHYKSFTIYEQNREHIDSSSLKTQLDFLSMLLSKNKNSDKSYFVYLHSISQHAPTQWLSYDRSIEEIQEELDNAKALINETSGYNGYYAYRLGQQYVDNCLRKFFKKLDSDGTLDNTVVVITADHGSSYCMNPVRSEQPFNNCHSELYHIPLVICEKNVKCDITGIYTHKDFLPTMLDIAGIRCEYSGRGNSIFLDSYNPHVALSERTTSGSPSLLHKDIIYTARNCTYLIEYKCNIFKDFSFGKLLHVYDISEDFEELNEINGKINEYVITDLLEAIKHRHEDLQANFNKWLKKNEIRE